MRICWRLAQRFEKGRLRAEDAVRIIGAGLRGAGHDVTDEQVKTMRTELCSVSSILLHGSSPRRSVKRQWHGSRMLLRARRCARQTLSPGTR